MREEMDEMTRNMNGLLELNQQMIRDILQLRMSVVHNRDNPIELDNSSERMFWTLLRFWFLNRSFILWCRSQS